MLSVTGLTKRYYGVDVLRNVSLSLVKGEVIGLIGRSGAGKSTLARCIVGLDRPEQGQLELDGVPIEAGKGAARKDIQYLWQDPSQALSPYLTAHKAVLETLNGFQIGAPADRTNQAAALLNRLGITDAMQARRPHALSGGQCQRVALARALAADPKVLILDEPFSALDLPMQIQTIKLLEDVHRDTHVAMLIASHDLAPLQRLADRVLVLDSAEVVEDVPMADFTNKAKHPLARAYIDTRCC